jgi:FAD-dependent oxidoreductase domain-containing protein 1
MSTGPVLTRLSAKFYRNALGFPRSCSSKSNNKGSSDEPIQGREVITETDLSEFEPIKASEVIVKSPLIKAKGGIPLNKDDYLPAERPWEAPKPESEILKPHPPPNYVDVRPFSVYISDDMSKSAVPIPLGAQQFRYPQFEMMENPFPDRPIPKFKGSFSQIVTNDEETMIPNQVDILIIGGGIVGTSIAYMCKNTIRECASIMVIEKDPTYSKASTTLSVGGIRQQFSLKENIQMSMFTSNFLRNAKYDLRIPTGDPPDFGFNLQGYLILASHQGAETLLQNHETQVEQGAYVDLLNRHQLAERFPWMNTEDIVLGAHGVQNEGWFDPWSLLIAMKGKAEWLGAKFLNAEFLDFNPKRQFLSSGMLDDTGDPNELCGQAIFRLPSGEERQIKFCQCVIAAGAESGEITKKLGIGTPTAKGIRSIPLPVERRKRYVYVFHCPDGPELDFPFLCDPSGVYCRREGLGGNYICGKCPSFEDEPDTANLDVDYNFFEEQIWPVLAHRVKAFERLKIVGAWAGYYDYNYFDQNAVIGKHPYYDNIFWATGFSGHGIQMGPAVGKAFTETITHSYYKTIDLQRLGWERILAKSPLKETNIL